MHYMKTLVVPDDKVREYSTTDNEPSRVIFSSYVYFIDGYYASVCAYSGDADPSWTEIMLFSPNDEKLDRISSESFVGEYNLNSGNSSYTIIVVSESGVRNDAWPNWWIDPVQFCRLLYELQELGIITPKVISDLAKKIDLPPDHVEELLDRSRDRWMMIVDDILGRKQRFNAHNIRFNSDAHAVRILCDFVNKCHLADQLDSFLSCVTKNPV